MHFTHYQITAGKVFAVNPNPSYEWWDSHHDKIEWEEFETWLSTQPPIYADPSIKDGVYAKELFEELWQYRLTEKYNWANFCVDGGFTYKNFHEFEKAYSDYQTRISIRLKQPVKQEEKYQSAQLTIGDTSFTKLADGFIQILTKNGCVELVPEEINELSKFINT